MPGLDRFKLDLGGIRWEFGQSFKRHTAYSAIPFAVYNSTGVRAGVNLTATYTSPLGGERHFSSTLEWTQDNIAELDKFMAYLVDLRTELFMVQEAQKGGIADGSIQ